MGNCCNKDKEHPPSQASAPEPPPPFRLTIVCEDYEVRQTLSLSADLPLSALKDLILRKLPQISFKKYCMKVGLKELGDDTASLKQLLIQNGDQIKLETVAESVSMSVERRAPRSPSLHHSLAMSSLDPTKRESEIMSQQYSSSAMKKPRSPLSYSNAGYSISEIVENEEHIRHEAANSRPTHAMLRGRLRDMSGEELKAKAEMSKEYSNTAKGKRLWETATRAAPLRNHVDWRSLT